MIIGGLQKLSLLDYPEHISAIIFTQGCNFKCQFCYNPMLVGAIAGKKDRPPQIGEDGLFEFLQSRVGKLDGIVITGGEPTIQPGLPDFIKKIRALGFEIKLDTNGTNPEMLLKLISGKLINYIAMDIKAPREKYSLITGVPADFEKIAESVKIIMESGLLYEFRTTVAPGLDKDDVAQMAELIKGARVWYLQVFKTDIDIVNNELKKAVPASSRELEEMKLVGEKYVKCCGVR